MKNYIKKNCSFFIGVCLLLAILVSMIAGQSKLMVRAEAFDVMSATEQEMTERSTELEETESIETESAETESIEAESIETESAETESGYTELTDLESEDTESETVVLEVTEQEFAEPEVTESGKAESTEPETSETDDFEQNLTAQLKSCSEESEATESDENGICAESDENGISTASDESGISTASDENGISTASDENIVLAASAATEVSGSLNLSSYNSGGSIILTGDTTASGQCQLSSGTLEIDLNGHTLTMGSGSYFMLTGGTLTIKDSSAEQTGVIYTSTYLVWMNGGTSTFNFESGTIDGSKASNPQFGGVVWTQESQSNFTYTINMSGGTIQNCTATQNGGAIYLCAANSHGSATFNMTGGTIQNCTAGQSGGAVYVSPSTDAHKTTFNMSGGVIQGCTAGTSGGAIYIDGGTETTNGIVNLSGYVVLQDNTAKSGSTSGAAECGSAIYVYGQLNVQGYIYIDPEDTVFLRNEWNGTGNNWIRVTGPLCVLGDGYFNVDTTYWQSGYESAYNGGSGYTVVYNASNGTVDDETFYTYRSYFYNATHSIGVSAGYATGGVTHVFKMTEHYMDYKDVLGQSWRVTDASAESSSPAYQSKEYLIYVDSGQSGNAQNYYSIKLLKYNLDGSSLLNDAEFTLYQASASGSETLSVDGVDVSVNKITTCTSGGIVEVGTGTAYFMNTNGTTSKLMLTDGTYYIVETKAPTGSGDEEYATISTVVVVTISGSTVTVNGNSLAASEAGTYSDSGYYSYSFTLQSNEIVLKAWDAEKVTEPEPEPEPASVILTAVKYGTSIVEGNQLAGAVYSVYASDDTTYTNPLGTATSADGTGSEEKGTLTFLDTNGDDLTLTAGSTYILHEITAPTGYVKGEDITITISEDGTGVVLMQGSDALAVYDDSNSGTNSGTEGASYYTWDAETNKLILYLTDETLYSLPGTNGTGIYREMAMGILLMCLTGLGLLCLRKKQQY